jgi:hypothetical protein
VQEKNKMSFVRFIADNSDKLRDGVFGDLAAMLKKQMIAEKNNLTTNSSLGFELRAQFGMADMQTDMQTHTH